MKRSKQLLAICIFSCVFALTALPGYAAGTHTEDFTTTTYKDAVNTTADWSTAAGELRLPPFAPSGVGSVATPGNAQGILVDGDYAYVADNFEGFRILDISDPTNPSIIGVLNQTNVVVYWGMCIDGDRAYVARGNQGLRIIDISDPTNPTLVRDRTLTNALSVVVKGDYAFLADDTSGLRVLDISNPLVSVNLVATLNTTGRSWHLCLEGDYIFLADLASGLHIIDISTPTSPSILGTYDTPGSAYAVQVAGDLAYVADAASGLQIIDISDPTNPTLVGSYDTFGSALEIDVEGNRAFIADGASGLAVIDVTNPASPALLHTYSTLANARDVDAAGDLAWVANASAIEAIRVAQPIPPTLVGSDVSLAGAVGVAVDGDHAFVAGSGNGMKIADISDPTAPAVIGSYSTPLSGVLDVMVAGDYAYATTFGDSAGLEIIDIGDPTTPTILGSHYISTGIGGQSFAVDLWGDFAFVADYDSGLVVIDISDPTNPTPVGSYDPGAPFTTDVAVADTIAFLANHSAGLLVVSVNTPSAPTQIGSFGTSGFAWGVTLAGNNAFVAAGVQGLVIVDISSPASPSLTGSLDFGGNASDVTVIGDYAFVADNFSSQERLRVIDISDPANPVLAGSGAIGSGEGVAIDGQHAFVVGSALDIIQVFQDEADVDSNIGHSLAIDSETAMIARARLTSTETAGVSWELSADGGSNWQSVTPDDGWNVFSAVGNDLMWRTTHTWAGENPTVSDLTIDWLNEYARITSITDVANDQGRQVSVEWNRSGHDFVGDPTQIVEYGVYRKIDPNLAVSMELSTPELQSLTPVVREHVLMMQAADWHFLMTVPVRVEDSYAVVVPTLADSTISGGDYQSIFMITAFTATPGVFFDSPPDSGYSLDNLAPSAPANFMAAYNTGSGNTLSWDEALDEDFQYFNVYRSTDPDFIPAPGDLVQSTTTNGWVDPDYDGWSIYYKITAVDFSGNESDPTSQPSPTGVPLLTPERFALYQNVPNPFNPNTMIAYDVPVAGARVTLRIYDVAGQLVREFVEENGVPGQRRFAWDGRTEDGYPAATGVYFYQLSAPGFSATRKMLLLK